MSEEQLSRRQEIASLYARYGATVHRRCHYVLRDDEAARDATQEVFVKVMRSIEAFRHDASPLTWILRIATNHCLNLRAAKQAAWHERFLVYSKQVREEAEGRSDHLERTEAVRRLIGKLDRETAQIAIHYHVDEMTQDEIAEAIGRSKPTIRKRLSKFLRVAKKELGHDFA